MSDSRILYDTFKRYYDSGIKNLEDGKLSIAKDNFLRAAESLLNLAKESTGTLKTQRVNRANELVELAEKIDKSLSVPKKSNGGESKTYTGSNHKIADATVDEEALKVSLEELNSLIGLNAVKQQVADMVSQIKVFKLRESQNLPTPVISKHLVFIGNPGTGKTTVARIIGEIYKALGILSSGHLVEVDRSQLVGEYQGQTAPKTKAKIDEARGGILFIDEAYSLVTDKNDSFGHEAIDTLTKYMEDYRNDLVVIVAGYANEMDNFINSNMGLKSRFKKFIDFIDYTAEELYDIFMCFVKKNKFKLAPDANRAVKAYLNKAKDGFFNGNARDVRNLFEDIVQLQARRLSNSNVSSKDELILIKLEDLPFDYNKEDIVNSNLTEKKLPNLNEDADLPENEVVDGVGKVYTDFKFNWDSLPIINFDDIAGLDNVKEIVKTKVLLPLLHPEAFDGYEKKNGGGLFLYGPPGTGKTMIGAAIANEIGAKFCSVKPSDLINQGAGNTEKAVRSLFSQARSFPCSVIYFDEMDSIAQKNTKSTYSRQLRSELLAQLQGIDSYTKENDNILFLIAATNKPWDVDSAFVRPGRFGTKVYVGLPDDEARAYMINSRFNKVREKGIVMIRDDVDEEKLVEATNGFNGSDITNLLDRIDEISALRGVKMGIKYICQDDVDTALTEITSSVQVEDIEKLLAWKNQNNG